MAIKVTLRSLLNAGPKQTEIAHRACALAESALNDTAFRERVVSAYYKETRFEDANEDWWSVPIDALTDMILTGSERGTEADGEVDLEVVLEEFREGVIGSTALGNFPIRTAYGFINECIEYNQPADLAGHFVHEWLHVCGFYHWPNNSARNDVAYNVGAIIRDIARGPNKAFTEMPDYLTAASCADTSGPVG